MKRNDILICIGVLIIATVVGLLIVAWNNTLWTQILFIVIEVLAIIGVVMFQRKKNIYRCMGCGTKVKVGFLADIEAHTLKNGDIILKCKKCGKKINFRQCEPEEIVIVDDAPVEEEVTIVEEQPVQNVETIVEEKTEEKKD